jgi:phosphorylcholine metabolism protein LicD
MNISLIIIIIFILITFLLGQYYQKYYDIKAIKEYINNTENERNTAMNGIDSKYYINFAFHYRLFNLFEIVTKKLDEKNISYFLIGGGLIGYFRHNQGFIPWDDDIDIGVMEEDRNKLHDVINEITKDNNYILLMKYCNYDIDKILYDKYNENPIQIDVFYFKYFPNKKYYNFNSNITQFTWPNQYIYTDELFPLKTINYILYDIYGNKFKEINIKIPNQSKIYLDRVYNKWEIIKKPSYSHSKYYKIIFS